MLITIYWYGVLAYVIGIILICVRAICDKRWKSFLAAPSDDNNGNENALALMRIIIAGIMPILHWLYAIAFIWIFFNDNEWHAVSDKILGQNYDER